VPVFAVLAGIASPARRRKKRALAVRSVQANPDREVCCCGQHTVGNASLLRFSGAAVEGRRGTDCRTRCANFGFGTLGPVFTQNIQTGRVGKGLASAVTPNAKSIAASEDQAKSSVGVDATVPPGF
jgi:hypothetical protein